MMTSNLSFFFLSALRCSLASVDVPSPPALFTELRVKPDGIRRVGVADALRLRENWIELKRRQRGYAHIESKWALRSEILAELILKHEGQLTSSQLWAAVTWDMGPGWHRDAAARQNLMERASSPEFNSKEVHGDSTTKKGGLEQQKFSKKVGLSTASRDSSLVGGRISKKEERNFLRVVPALVSQRQEVRNLHKGDLTFQTTAYEEVATHLTEAVFESRKDVLSWLLSKGADKVSCYSAENKDEIFVELQVSHIKQKIEERGPFDEPSIAESVFFETQCWVMEVEKRFGETTERTTDGLSHALSQKESDEVAAMVKGEKSLDGSIPFSISPTLEVDAEDSVFKTLPGVALRLEAHQALLFMCNDTLSALEDASKDSSSSDKLTLLNGLTAMLIVCETEVAKAVIESHTQNQIWREYVAEWTWRHNRWGKSGTGDVGVVISENSGPLMMLFCDVKGGQLMQTFSEVFFADELETVEGMRTPQTTDDYFLRPWLYAAFFASTEERAESNGAIPLTGWMDIETRTLNPKTSSGDIFLSRQHIANPKLNFLSKDPTTPGRTILLPSEYERVALKQKKDVMMTDRGGSLKERLGIFSVRNDEKNNDQLLTALALGTLQGLGRTSDGREAAMLKLTPFAVQASLKALLDEFEEKSYLVSGFSWISDEPSFSAPKMKERNIADFWGHTTVRAGDGQLPTPPAPAWQSFKWLWGEETQKETREKETLNKNTLGFLRMKAAEILKKLARGLPSAEVISASATDIETLVSFIEQHDSRTSKSSFPMSPDEAAFFNEKLEVRVQNRIPISTTPGTPPKEEPEDMVDLIFSLKGEKNRPEVGEALGCVMDPLDELLVSEESSELYVFSVPLLLELDGKKKILRITDITSWTPHKDWSIWWSHLTKRALLTMGLGTTKSTPPTTTTRKKNVMGLVHSTTATENNNDGQTLLDNEEVFQNVFAERDLVLWRDPLFGRDFGTAAYFLPRISGMESRWLNFRIYQFAQWSKAFWDFWQELIRLANEGPRPALFMAIARVRVLLNDMVKLRRSLFGGVGAVGIEYELHRKVQKVLRKEAKKGSTGDRIADWVNRAGEPGPAAFALPLDVAKWQKTKTANPKTESAGCEKKNLFEHATLLFEPADLPKAWVLHPTLNGPQKEARELVSVKRQHDDFDNTLERALWRQPVLMDTLAPTMQQVLEVVALHLDSVFARDALPEERFWSMPDVQAKMDSWTGAALKRGAAERQHELVGEPPGLHNAGEYSKGGVDAWVIGVLDWMDALKGAESLEKRQELVKELNRANKEAEAEAGFMGSGFGEDSDSGEIMVDSKASKNARKRKAKKAKKKCEDVEEATERVSDMMAKLSVSGAADNLKNNIIFETATQDGEEATQAEHGEEASQAEHGEEATQALEPLFNLFETPHRRMGRRFLERHVWTSRNSNSPSKKPEESESPLKDNGSDDASDSQLAHTEASGSTSRATTEEVFPPAGSPAGCSTVETPSQKGLLDVSSATSEEPEGETVPLVERELEREKPEEKEAAFRTLLDDMAERDATKLEEVAETDLLPSEDFFAGVEPQDSFESLEEDHDDWHVVQPRAHRRTKKVPNKPLAQRLSSRHRAKHGNRNNHKRAPNASARDITPQSPRNEAGAAEKEESPSLGTKKNLSYADALKGTTLEQYEDDGSLDLVLEEACEDAERRTASCPPRLQETLLEEEERMQEKQFFPAREGYETSFRPRSPSRTPSPDRTHRDILSPYNAAMIPPWGPYFTASFDAEAYQRAEQTRGRSPDGRSPLEEPSLLEESDEEAFFEAAKEGARRRTLSSG